MENKLDYQDYKLSGKTYYCDMVQYKDYDEKDVDQKTLIDYWEFRKHYKTVAKYLKKHGFDLLHYNKKNGILELQKDIEENRNEIVVNCDVIEEEEIAILTFFDKSRQGICVKNSGWRAENW